MGAGVGVRVAVRIAVGETATDGDDETLDAEALGAEGVPDVVMLDDEDAEATVVAVGVPAEDEDGAVA